MSGWKASQKPGALEYGVDIYFLDGKKFFGPLMAEKIEMLLLEHFDRASFVDISWERGKLNLGGFQIWLNKSRAFVRLDEHCEHYATDPDMSYDISQGSENFPDVGQWGFGQEIFTQDFHQTITKAQALAAALHWLETGDKLESLIWS